MLTRTFRLAATVLVLAASPALAQPDEGPDAGLPPPPPPKTKIAARRPAFPTTIATEFDPKRDGMPFENLGDLGSPDGNCWGMSLLAIDNYLRRREGQPVPAEPGPIARKVHEGHVTGQMAASLAQKKVEEKPDDDNENPAAGLRDPAQMRAALERIARTGEPEVLGLYPADDSGHAAVVFGYRNGKLQIYDPNYPGETIEWPWDPDRGFTAKHPKAKDDPFYRSLARVASTPYSQHATAAEIPGIRQACESGAPECVARIPTIAAEVAPRPGDPKGRVDVRGRVTGGMEKGADGKKPLPPRGVWVSVNGKPVAFARVQKDGTFRATLPRSVLGQDSNTVRFVAGTGRAGADPGALAGFGERQVARPTPGVGLTGAVGRAR